MSRQDYMFTNGEEIACPECPRVVKQWLTTKGKPRSRVDGPMLFCTERNYSGCSVDIGHCEECGKGFEISYAVKEITRVPSWDGETREQREASEARWREEQKAERRKEYEALKKEFEG